jgi:hypothetical protein
VIRGTDLSLSTAALSIVLGLGLGFVGTGTFARSTLRLSSGGIACLTGFLNGAGLPSSISPYLPA